MLTACALYTVRPFRPSDLDSLVNRDGTQVSHKVLAMQAMTGPSWTALSDDVPMGCAGVVLPWPGIGLCWMVVSDELGQHGLWLTRTVRTFLREVVRQHQLHRLEAVSVNGDNGRWL